MLGPPRRQAELHHPRPRDLPVPACPRYDEDRAGSHGGFDGTLVRQHDDVDLSFHDVDELVGVGVLLVAAAIPRLRQVLKAYGEPKPAAPPPGYRVWPLWFVSLAFYHDRLAGGLFVLGLVLNALLGL